MTAEGRLTVPAMRMYLERKAVKMRKWIALLCSSAMLFGILAGCTNQNPGNDNSAAPGVQQSDNAGTPNNTDNTEDKIRIGVSFANLQEERWNREKVYMQEKADELGVEIVFQDGNNEESKQLDQVQNMVSDGIDVLIIVPANADTAATAVAAAKDSGVPVIDYAKFINSDKCDVYIGFSIEQLGVDMAKSAVEIVPKGNYALISGSPNDANTDMCIDGYFSVLQPYIDRGDITVVFDQKTENYSPEKAMNHAENALTQTDNNIDLFLIMNDGMAGGVVAALKQQGLDGQIPVTGLDGELAACQRIAEGTQAFSLYFPLKEQGGKAIDTAVELAQGKTPSLIDGTTETDFGPIPTITLHTKTITKNMSTPI